MNRGQRIAPSLTRLFVSFPMEGRPQHKGRAGPLAALALAVGAAVAAMALCGIWFVVVAAPATTTRYWGRTDPYMGAWAAAVLLLWAVWLAAASVAALGSRSGGPAWRLLAALALAGGVLTFLTAIAHATSLPPEGRGAGALLVASLVCCVSATLAAQHATPRPARGGLLQERSDGAGWCGLALALLVLAGVALTGNLFMVAQAVTLATRMTPTRQRFAVADGYNTQLFVNCTALSPLGSNNATAMPLVLVGHIDHSASYYAPLLDQLASQNIPACAWDPAGVGFSDAGGRQVRGSICCSAHTMQCSRAPQRRWLPSWRCCSTRPRCGVPPLPPLGPWPSPALGGARSWLVRCRSYSHRWWRAWWRWTR